MLAKKCDRCNALYEVYGESKRGKENSIEFMYSSATGGIYRTHNFADLCPACMEKLRDFMKVGRVDNGSKQDQG